MSFRPHRVVMALHPLVASPIVAVLAASLVYVDAGRRDLPRRTRLGWTAGVGILSLGGFLAVYLFDGVLARTYLLLGGEPFVVRSPREVVTVLFLLGLAISAAAVLAYGLGSRYGPLAAS